MKEANFCVIFINKAAYLVKLFPVRVCNPDASPVRQIKQSLVIARIYFFSSGISSLLSQGGGWLLPLSAGVGFGRNEGLSGKGHFLDRLILGQYTIPQSGKFDVVGFCKAMLPPHLPL